MLKIAFRSCIAPSPYTHLPIRRFSQAIHFNRISELCRQWGLVKRSFKERGFVRLQAGDSKVGTLKHVGDLFGNAQKHVRNPITGITDIIGESHPKGRKNHQVASNKEFLPHTDGTYLSGMARSEDGKYYRVGPPKFILLQCVKPSSDGGGTSILVDGQKILHSMIEKDPFLLRSVFSPISILRGIHLIMDVPIFQQTSRGSYTLRFSYDSDLYMPKNLQLLLASFNEKYIHNEQYRMTEQLKSGEILVIDNSRILHARTAFAGERFFRRLWIHDNAESEELVNPPESQALYYQSELPSDSPTEKYAIYGRVAKTSSKIRPVPAGIYLSPRLKRILNLHILGKSVKTI